MKVNFDNTHLVGYGKEYEFYANSYAYGYVYDKHPMSQIQICITGDPKFILDKLKKVISEMEHQMLLDKEGNEIPNKPSQGIIVHNNAYVSEIITPVWNGKFDEDVVMPEIEKSDEEEKLDV